MFKFFKDKLKAAISKFTKEVEKEIEERMEKEEKKTIGLKKEIKKAKEKPKKEKKGREKILEQEEKKGLFQKIFRRIGEKEESSEEKTKEEQKKEEKKGFLQKVTEFVTKTSISEDKFDSFFWDLEVAMLENNVAVSVIEKIKKDLKTQLVDQKIDRFKIDETITEALKKSLSEILTFEKINLLKKIDEKKPFVIVFVGINGSGKTTTIAKIANLLLKNKKSVVIAASDTFRAAAIQQLEEHANRLKVKLIKHDYGADAAAVAFDAIKYAEAKKIDVVLIDTAGRLHSNINLMDEMKKIIRVARPDMKIFIGESITGNDCVEQAQQFNEAIGIDGIILAKADVDEKGGAAISVSYVTNKPILYLGTGQEYDDLEEFDKQKILKGLGF